MKGGSEVIRGGGGSSVSVVEAGMALCEHVQRQGLQGHLFSDITLICMGKEYHLHRIILSQSSYFYSLLSGPWKENGKPRIELQIDDPNVSAEGLEIAFAYMYGVNPKLNGENAMAALAAGCFLCMENLCDKCVQFIVADLRVDTFVPYQQLSERHCYGRFADSIRNACWTFLCTHASRELVHLLPKLSLQVCAKISFLSPSFLFVFKFCSETLLSSVLILCNKNTYYVTNAKNRVFFPWQKLGFRLSDFPLPFLYWCQKLHFRLFDFLLPFLCQWQKTRF
jgi:hypothetical protein